MEKLDVATTATGGRPVVSMPAAIRVGGVLECLAQWEPRLLTRRETAELVVRGPAALDLHELADGDGSVLLAAGTSDAATEDFLARAGSHGATLLVVRGDETPQWSLPDDGSCAVISLAKPVAWRHVDAALDVLFKSVDSTPLPGLSVSTTGDLFALANGVAAVVGGAVTVEDTEMRVLAYSNWPHHKIDDMRRNVILQRQVPKDASP